MVPVTLAEARRFVGTHHRHNLPPITWKFGVGIVSDDGLIGVAIAGLPKSRVLAADPFTLEVNRTCTDGTKNANSMLYGAIARAAKALGYRKLITYTLEIESGVSLRAAGWTVDAELADRDPAQWSTHPRNSKPQQDLFGNERRPGGKKLRWIKVF